MNKLGQRLAAIGIAASLLGSGLPAAATATTSSEIAIVKQDSVVPADSPPMIVEGRVLVPVRLISETLGFPVHWDAPNRDVIVNQHRLVLDVEPRIVEGRAMVPIRSVSEHLGVQIVWQPDRRQVVLDVDLAALLEEAIAETEQFLAWATTEYGVFPGTEVSVAEQGDIEALNRFINGRFAALREARLGIVHKTKLIQGFYADELTRNEHLQGMFGWFEQAGEMMEYSTMKQFISLKHEDAIPGLQEAAKEFRNSLLLLERG